MNFPKRKKSHWEIRWGITLLLITFFGIAIAWPAVVSFDPSKLSAEQLIILMTLTQAWPVAFGGYYITMVMGWRDWRQQRKQSICKPVNT